MREGCSPGSSETERWKKIRVRVKVWVEKRRRKGKEKWRKMKVESKGGEERRRRKWKKRRNEVYTR